jgi:hypothetical protein
MAGLMAGALGLTGCETYAGELLTRFDVAEDHTRFVFAPQPVHENGMPAYGNPFVTQGYIYPAGTLAGNVTGVNEDGSPAFPDKVLGTWTCDGWFVGEGGNTETGVWLVSRQIYEFADGDVLITQGTEIADIDKSNARPITGGSGDYADVDGVMMQRLLGFNEHMGVNAGFEIVDRERQSSFAPIHVPEWKEETNPIRAD